MGVDWGNPQDVEQFRQYALEKGLPAKRVNEFIQENTVKAQPKQTVSMPMLQFTDQGELARKSPVKGADQDLLETDRIPESPIFSSTETRRADPMRRSVDTNLPTPPQSAMQQVSMQSQDEELPTMLERSGPVTQEFGNRSSVERYSGGVNYGTDIAVPKGTKVAAPPGEWQVIEAFNKARAEGPNNPQRGINRGYGNSVLLQNQETGEKIRMSHLTVNGVRVKPGERVEGGQVIGETGATGNTAGKTGQHLDLEYYDPQGRIRDIRRTRYWNHLGV